MTGNIKINAINEITNLIDFLDTNNDESKNNDSDQLAENSSCSNVSNEDSSLISFDNK